MLKDLYTPNTEQNFIKEQLLHNFVKYFSGPWANEIVNKNINDESSCFSNLSFSVS